MAMAMMVNFDPVRLTKRLTLRQIYCPPMDFCSSLRATQRGQRMHSLGTGSRCLDCAEITPQLSSKGLRWSLP